MQSPVPNLRQAQGPLSAPAEGAAARVEGPSIARVVLDSPLPQLDHAFDYAIPDDLRGRVGAGMRVRVPLRVAGRIADAYVVETTDRTQAPGRLSPLDRLVSPVPVLAPEVWGLARAVADRAAGTASDVLRLAVPKRQVRVEQAWLAADPPPVRPIRHPAGAPAIVLPLLAGRRIAAEAGASVVALGSGTPVLAWTTELAAVASAIADGGRSVIVSVPDRRDLDQLLLALAETAAADTVLRVDAAQPAAARYRAHLAALRPGPHILVGNRSAVYAPASDLGAILIWDEADAFHREPLSPGVATRDAALIRQEQSGCGLLFLAHARSSTVQRLVQLGWVQGGPPPRATPRVVITPDGDTGTRIPSAAWKDAADALRTGPVLVQVAKPGDAALRAVLAGEAPVPIDAGRTAHELGRAFPGVRVLIADGDDVRTRVDPDPALVVATRGAEPIVAGGYGAVLLLDGTRMLARESLWVAEDCLRWWSNAAALAAPRAPVHLIGVRGDVATALATWNSPEFAARQLADRRILHFPPATRVVSVTGAVAPVEALVADLIGHGAVVVSRTDDDGRRVVLRFEYGAGAALAGAAKAALVGVASTRRPGPPGTRRAAPTLRVRFDAHDLL